ncbi:unnamed protein product [Zymoseptoria tritici ST99CH_1A5]|uniref:Uncharacterized protein n=1 Tax=Zymoseptoria tritici ST99CH_1A5 TaxID=1276529 RepID=A0A1Y6LEH0_ZYMTR|nr:unnamed protein product [Zymoseptoria tritici ST99CH_1A5]
MNMYSFSTQRNTYRIYTEYADLGCRVRQSLSRTATNKQLRTDRIGSRHARWKARTDLDYNLALDMRDENNYARAVAFWETNPCSQLRDPYANVVGWYMGKIDKQSWISRPVSAHRRIRPAKLMPKGKSVRHDAYFKVKAEREASEAGEGDILTAADDGWLRGKANVPGTEFATAARRRDQQIELERIIASLKHAGALPTSGAWADGAGRAEASKVRDSKGSAVVRSAGALLTPLDTSDEPGGERYS